MKDKTTARESMAKDIVARHLLTGLTKPEVRALLGPPPEDEEYAKMANLPGIPDEVKLHNTFNYPLGKPYCILSVCFEADRVTHVHMGTTGGL